MTPKGLLRLKDASSSPDDLARGASEPVLDDAARRQGARCAGSSSAPARSTTTWSGTRRTPGGEVAVARVEQLYPFPTRRRRGAGRRRTRALDEVVWAQEEPQNMGPWRSIRHRLEEAAAGAPLRYVGRPWRASPSEGYPTAHGIEQDRIARAALTL